MNAERFKAQYDIMLKNIDEIKTIVGKPPETASEQAGKTMGKVRYLYNGLVLTLVDVGNSIIFENNYRPPRNKADIFISLAEQKILAPNVIVGVKKAVFAQPKINNFSDPELLKVIGDSIDALGKTLGFFAVHFNRKQTAADR